MASYLDPLSESYESIQFLKCKICSKNVMVFSCYLKLLLELNHEKVPDLQSFQTKESQVPKYLLCVNMVF